MFTVSDPFGILYCIEPADTLVLCPCSTPSSTSSLAPVRDQRPAPARIPDHRGGSWTYMIFLLIT